MHRKSRYEKRHYVYMIRVESNYKIGLSSDVKSRMVSIQSLSPSQVELVHTWSVGSYKRAQAFEKKLHREYAHVNKKGEWFTLSKKEIDTLIGLGVEDILGDIEIAERLEIVKDDHLEFLDIHGVGGLSTKGISILRSEFDLEHWDAMRINSYWADTYADRMLQTEKRSPKGEG